MAELPKIDTGYKPDGPLGALYQGFNAANANDMANLDIIKQYLANQREQQMQPLDLRVRSMEAARADRAATPEMLDAYANGYIGQMNTQQAAGNKAMQTWQGEADLANRTNANALDRAKLLTDLYNQQRSDMDNSGSIGFQMNPSQPPAPTISNNPFAPNAARNIPLIKEELARVKKGSDQEFILNQELAKEQGLNTNNSPIVQNGPKRINGDGIVGSPRHEQIMRALTDTPEHRQKLALGDQRGDIQEYLKILELQEKVKAAELKAQQEHPPTMSQAEAAMRNRLAANPNDQEAAKWLREYEIFKQRTQPGMGQVTLNPTDNTLTTVGGNLGGSGGNDLQAAILAEIERRKTQGK